MLTAAEVRRARLEQLIAKHGSIAALNDALGWPRTDPKFSQIRNASMRAGRERPHQMGDAMAREIEEKLRLERGWMDTPIGYELVNNESVAHMLQVMETMTPYKIAQAAKIIEALATPDQ